MNLFKQRNLIEMFTRPATEEERRGERNSKYLGYAIILAIVCVFLFGAFKLIQLAIG